MIPWLDTPDFPPVEDALEEPAGLLAAGGELTPEWLLAAYPRGIFPWFSEGQPILWWSLDPRMILIPSSVKIRRSLKQTYRQHPWQITLNQDFPAVIQSCAAISRRGQPGTWITEDMQAAYIELHRLGYAHSVEIWCEGELCGGLYGLALGQMFFGESMFSRRSNASKLALVALCQWLDRQEIRLIDCQMQTEHLAFMGGGPIQRRTFTEALEVLIPENPAPYAWPAQPLPLHF